MQTPPSFTSMSAPIPPAPQRVRFDAIGDAWRLYMADMGQWVGGVLLAAIIAAAPIFVIELVVFAALVPGGMFGGATGAFGSPTGLQSVRTASLIIALVGIPCNACTQLLVVGLQRRALLQQRGFASPITEMFSLGGMGLHVLAFNVLSVLLSMPAQLYSAFTNNTTNPFSFFDPAHIVILGGLWLVMGALHVLFGFTPLIIVDQRLGVGPALAKCATTFAPQFFPLVGVLICTYVLVLCGLLACGIGVLFTAPLLITIYGVIYNDFFRPVQIASAEAPSGWYPRPT